MPRSISEVVTPDGVLDTARLWVTAELKKDGKVFSYFTYPGEGHGFQQRDHRKDAYEREPAFLQLYLQPDGVH